MQNFEQHLFMDEIMSKSCRGTFCAEVMQKLSLQTIHFMQLLTNFCATLCIFSKLVGKHLPEHIKKLKLCEGCA